MPASRINLSLLNLPSWLSGLSNSPTKGLVGSSSKYHAIAYHLYSFDKPLCSFKLESGGRGYLTSGRQVWGLPCSRFCLFTTRNPFLLASAERPKKDNPTFLFPLSSLLQSLASRYLYGGQGGEFPLWGLGQSPKVLSVQGHPRKNPSSFLSKNPSVFG